MMEMNNSITEMIERKNEQLKRSFETLNNIRDLSTMCKDVNFSELEAASTYIKTVGETLRRLALFRYDLLCESNIALPEAENPAESIKDGEEVTADDLPFC